MTNMQPGSELSVDRREETVVTQQPGYAATEQVTRDVAAERRMGQFQLTRILMTVLGVLEILLALRFVLHLIAANAASGFSQLIYGLSGLFVAPFTGLVGTPTSGGTTVEMTTLIAMAVYALLFWIIMRIIPIVVDRPSARTISRVTREQTPNSAGGVETDRTTHTTIS
jgi:uncharacterized membrane protein